MSSSFWLLRVESLDFSQADKERTACKAEQIHKLITIFTQNGQVWQQSENSCHFVNLLNFTSSSFFLSMRKIMWLYSQQPKTRGHVEEHLIRSLQKLPLTNLGLEILTVLKFVSVFIIVYCNRLRNWNSKSRLLLTIFFCPKNNFCAVNMFIMYLG